MLILYFIFLALFIQICSSNPHFKDSTPMGNCLNISSSKMFSQRDQLPTDTVFRIPSPLPTWPPGGGFAGGIIDLGGLKVCQISTFNKVWTIQEGGPDNLGATFYEPSLIPDGFFMLGCYSQPNNKATFGWVLAAKDESSSKTILKKPTDYTLVWSTSSSQDNVGYVWLPTPPEGYESIGYVVTNSSRKPSLKKVRCVRSDFTDVSENGTMIWDSDNGDEDGGITIYESRPKDRGIQALGVSAGTFIVQTNESVPTVVCLKNVENNLSSMPNLNQVQALIQEYSPWIYFHSEEEYLPSSVNWFFENGALLYTKGQESNPSPISPNGSNLPQGGSNDGAYWLDLPIDDSTKDKVKKGNLQDAMTYIHVKPMLGGSFTDLAIWVFYPFNGGARAKVEFITISLGKIGEHVGDWEHVTLRISNFNGELKGVYFSQHSKGTWLSASELEFQNGNKFVVYASLHGHATYPKEGDFLQGTEDIGITNDTEKSKMVLDTSGNYSIVCGEYLGIVEPPWLNYAREWGPKISYDIDEEIMKIEKLLPGKLKSAFDKVIKDIPSQVLGEEGPTGPKWKDNWNGDERD